MGSTVSYTTSNFWITMFFLKKVVFNLFSMDALNWYIDQKWQQKLLYFNKRYK